MKHHKLSPEVKSYIKKRYCEDYSVTIVLREVKDQFDPSLGRSVIVNYLKEIGLYEGLSGPNFLAKKVENQVKYLQHNYGVSNWSQMAEGGFKKQNSIPYKRMQISSDIEAFKNRVEKCTRKYTNQIIKNGTIPKRCEYTGVEFADVAGEVNPNHPLKRTVDHMVPVTHAFVMGWTVEQVCDPSNIKYIIRLVNGLKGNTHYDNFKLLLPHINRLLTNEGYQHN